jgi:putative iron-dependent peroxidase
MAQPQKGICAEPNLHATYLLLNVVDEDASIVRQKVSDILDIFERFDHEYYEAMVSGVVGVGMAYWSELYPGLIPMELAPFPDIQVGRRIMPDTQTDLYIQIRADRTDICYAIGIQIMDILKPYVSLVEQISAFRYLDGRDLTGFVDGTENPKGMRKLDVAIVGDDDQDFSGGSYLHVQRYIHKLDKWKLMPLKDQESIIGRTKADNMEFPVERKAPFAHTRLTSLKDSNGTAIEILRQSMPYGDMHQQGLYFVSCAKSPKPFTMMLKAMVMGNSIQGHYDKLLDYTEAVTGAAFFAPSVTFIKQKAKQDA